MAPFERTAQVGNYNNMCYCNYTLDKQRANITILNVTIIGKFLIHPILELYYIQNPKQNNNVTVLTHGSHF